MLTTALVGGAAVAGIGYYFSSSAEAGASPGKRRCMQRWGTQYLVYTTYNIYVGGKALIGNDEVTWPGGQWFLSAIFNC